ncbi:replication initiation protein [Persephonella sp.]|uniref:replication initiation protein n=1 Tax=Persephonella sp. TaxID=2060922 RepID=UPI0025D5BCAE|nr:replication initiation protein [Persephonella sp.]
MTKEEKQKIDELVMKTFTLAYELGTNLDELHKQFRQLRFSTKDRDLEAAIVNLEHAFFMTAQSINILKEQTRNALVPLRKAHTCEE